MLLDTLAEEVTETVTAKPRQKNQIKFEVVCHGQETCSKVITDLLVGSTICSDREAIAPADEGHDCIRNLGKSKIKSSFRVVAGTN